MGAPQSAEHNGANRLADIIANFGAEVLSAGESAAIFPLDTPLSPPYAAERPLRIRPRSARAHPSAAGVPAGFLARSTSPWANTSAAFG